MTSAEVARFLQKERRADLKQIGTETWTTIYSYGNTNGTRGGYFCALVAEPMLRRVMEHDSWDLHIGDGLPGFSQRDSQKGKTVTMYHRLGDDNGIEPLVIKRTFHGIKPNSVELLEEFRHYHNLYHDRHSDRYIRIDDGGEEEVVAEVVNGAIRAKTRRLREFLAARQMHLAVFFDFDVISNVDPEALPVEEREVAYREEGLRYSFYTGKIFENRPFSRLVGKKLVPPLQLEQCGKWPHDEKKSQYAEFITDVDADGNNVLHTCDPDVADYGGTKGGAHFLMPVVFRREVLKKYYEHPEKYHVDDGYLSCGSLWGLNIDNDAAEHVTVFLGDLGQSLTYEEQLYWKSFNIAPQGGGKDLSDVAIKRALHGEFADPWSPDLRFKAALTEFQEAWEARHRWQLIRNLRDEDAHVIKRLRMPLTPSSAEFEDQVLSLTKLLVDSLNDKELARELGGALKDEKSIAKLERFLSAKAYPQVRRDIDFLRLLQDARSGTAAHRKGDAYKKLSQRLGLTSKPAAEVFGELLTSAVAMLEDMQHFFLAPSQSGPAN